MGWKYVVAAAASGIVFLGGASTVQAQSNTIYMAEGALPLVSADIVDRIGADTTTKWLGSPFIVGGAESDWDNLEPGQNGKVGALFADKRKPKPVPGWPFPRGPRCVCPESFVADLAGRSEVLAPLANQ